MNSLSDIRALVVTLDPMLVSTMHELSREFGIDADTTSSQPLPEGLSCEKYEALLLDFDTIPETTLILSAFRGVPSNKSAVILAVATGPELKKAAFVSGANFVFERPLKLDEMRSTLSTAYDLMRVERRRYFRFSISLQVQLTSKLGERIICTTMNISSNGMAVRTQTSLKVAENLELTFTLPNATEIRAAAVVVWDDKHGKSGLHFQCDGEMSRRLDEWLDLQFAA